MNIPGKDYVSEFTYETDRDALLGALYNHFKGIEKDRDRDQHHDTRRADGSISRSSWKREEPIEVDVRRTEDSWYYLIPAGLRAPAQEFLEFRDLLTPPSDYTLQEDEYDLDAAVDAELSAFPHLDEYSADGPEWGKYTGAVVGLIVFCIGVAVGALL